MAPSTGLLRHSKEGSLQRPLDWGQRKALEKIDADLAARARARTAALAAGRIGLAEGGPWLLLASGEPGPVRAGRKPTWFVNGQGMTFMVIPGPVEFTMGAPASEQQAPRLDVTQHRRRIGRTYALATKAVTVAQWKQFLKERPRMSPDYGPDYSPEEDCRSTR